MCRASCLSRKTSWTRFGIAALCMLVFQGCATMKRGEGSPAPLPAPPGPEMKRTAFPLPPGCDVVGDLAALTLEKGDTLPVVARHFGLGVNAVSAANPGVDVWVPEPGNRIILPLRFILPDAPRRGLVVNLASMRLFHFKKEKGALVVSTYPVGIGTREKPTPNGQMRVKRKATRPTWHVPASIAADHGKKGDFLPAEVPPGPDNPLGECALYLSRSGYLIHGTNKPSSIGLNATNGCMRMYPEDVKKLYEETSIDTPVAIVNQPYLVGRRNGVLYLEVHRPQEGTTARGEGQLYAALRKLEAQWARPFDWDRIKEVVAQARGVPVSIAKTVGGAGMEHTVEVGHPALLYGTPQVPELTLDAWYLLAADVGEEVEAARISAMINHQGPPIPARVIRRSNNNGYRVLAGPFPDIGKAKDAAKRLKIDLELDAVLVEPVQRR